MKINAFRVRSRGGAEGGGGERGRQVTVKSAEPACGQLSASHRGSLAACMPAWLAGWIRMLMAQSQ